MTYFQAIPLYLKSDQGASEYFQRFRAEADAISGSFPILLPAEVEAADAGGIVPIFDQQTGQERYPGLQRADLPCLWLEDGQGAHDVLRLPHDGDKIGAYIAAMTDAAKTATSASELKQRVTDALVADARDRSPALQVVESGKPMATRPEIIAAAISAVVFTGAIFAAGLFYPGPSTDKAIAVLCGVIFVLIILVVALFIPKPTDFQERVFRIVLSLSSAGFIAMTPGFLEIAISTWIKASGALAVFVIVYFYNPASLLPKQP